MTRTYDDDVQPTLDESAPPPRDLLRMAITPTPLPNPDAQITDLVRQVTELQDAKEALHTEVSALKRDLNIISDATLREAENRDWCGEYEEFVSITNGRLSQPWLQRRTQDRIAVFSVSFTYTCGIGESEACLTALRESLQDGAAYELPGSADLQGVTVTCTADSVD